MENQIAKIAIFTKEHLESLGLESLKKPIFDFLHFFATLNSFEKIFLCGVLLFVSFLILWLFLKFLRGILFSLAVLLGIKKKKRKLEIVSGKIATPSSLDFKQKGFFALWNKARLLAAAYKLARIEEEIQKDKPVRLSLSQAIFVIQNYDKYNYFAAEDGKIKFEKVKKQIDEREAVIVDTEIEEEKEQKQLETPEQIVERMTGGRAKIIFDDDGNIASFKDIHKEQEEALKKVQRNDMSNFAPKNIPAKTPSQNGVKSDGNRYESWSKQMNAEGHKNSGAKPNAEERTNLTQKERLENAKEAEAKIREEKKAHSAKDLKMSLRFKNSGEKQAKKDPTNISQKGDGIEVIEMPEAIANLNNLDVSDFDVDFIGKEPEQKKEKQKNAKMMKAALKESQKPKTQNKSVENKKNTEKKESQVFELKADDFEIEKPVVKTEQSKPKAEAPKIEKEGAKEAQEDYAATFVMKHCTKEDIENKEVFIDKKNSMVLFKKSFFSKLGKPQDSAREKQYWGKLEGRYNIRLELNVLNEYFDPERLIGLKIRSISDLNISQ